MDFAYNASALGAGGVIERNVDRRHPDRGKVVYTIPSLASVALPPTGGEGRSVVTNYYSEELEFSHAETRVYGRGFRDDKGEALFTTSTYVLMRDVRVFDSLRIAEMRSVVTSTRGFSGGDDHDFDIEVSFEGVRIGRTGRAEIDPRIDESLRGLRRYDQFEKFIAKTNASRDRARALAERFNAPSADDLTRAVQAKQPVQGTLVEQIDGLEKMQGVAERGTGQVVRIPGLGTVRFAELMIKPGRRRLNLVRIKFGFGPNGHEMTMHPQQEGAMPQALTLAEGASEESFSPPPDDGSMTLGSGEGNGTPIGP